MNRTPSCFLLLLTALLAAGGGFWVGSAWPRAQGTSAVPSPGSPAVPGVRGVDFDGFPDGSGGFSQRLDASRAIAPDPDVPVGAELLVLVDDPFTRLDVIA